MTTLAEHISLAGAENRPPMLEKSLQHERHANEVRIMRERYPDPLALVANSQTLYNPSQSPQHSDFGLAVPTFQQGEDPTDYINKAMAFLSAMASRVTVQQVQRKQSQSFVGPENRGIATTSKGNYAASQEKTIPQNSAFQTKDFDAYDSDCDDISSTNAVLMANLSSCDSDVLSEVPYSDTYPNDMINRDLKGMSYSEQTHIDNFLDNEITSDSNIISYSQYLQESQDAGI
uniref:Uncharacterized protein n=1 Tax=Tanacetum cinerariifolium TaxID=118510 RepID=A0A699IUD1_TANCI|nr:hypothetical protein [Tanacetum cinerariifolium]